MSRTGDRGVFVPGNKTVSDSEMINLRGAKMC